jgi:hypothetical protein
MFRLYILWQVNVKAPHALQHGRQTLLWGNNRPGADVGVCREQDAMRGGTNGFGRPADELL